MRPPSLERDGAARLQTAPDKAEEDPRRKALHPRNEELAMLLRIAMVPKRHLRGEALVYVIKVAQGRAAGTIRPGTVGHEELMEQYNLTLAELQETTGAKRHRLSLPVVSEDVLRMH